MLILNPLCTSVLGVTDLQDPAMHGAPLVVFSTMAGLLAGISEEGSRWLFYRFWIQPVGSENVFPKVLLFGLGHGGCEALIVGVFSVCSVIVMTIASGEDFAQAYWALPTGQFLLAPIERLYAMAAHVAMSLFVWRGFVTNQQAPWLGLAIVYHTALDAVAVFALRTWGVYLVEIILEVTFFPISLYVLVHYVKVYRSVRGGFEEIPQEDGDQQEETVTPSPLQE